MTREYHKKSQGEHEKGDSGGQEGGRSDRQAIPQQRAIPKEYCEKEKIEGKKKKERKFENQKIISTSFKLSPYTSTTS